VGRLLTPGEIELARTLYRDSLAYDAVRVHRRRYVWFQDDHITIAPNGHIYAVALYRDDYSEADDRMRAHFMHEMAHVWQKQNRVLNPILSAIWLWIRHLGRYARAYRYELDASKDLLDYGMEQQAAILEDYFRGGREPARLAVLARFLADPEYPRAVD